MKSPSPDIASRILIVDDDAATLLALKTVLDELGQPVLCARSGEEALSCVLKHDFAVILLDAHMPGLDGYQTAAIIRGREKSRRIPIIFMSAVNKDEVHMFRGYSAGAVDYVFKPVEPHVLKSKVGVFVELFRATEEARRQAELERELLVEHLRVRTEKLRTEEELRRSEARQSLIIASLPVALYAAEPVEPLASRRFVGDNVERLTGYPAARFLDEAGLWLSRIEPGCVERVKAELAAARAGQTFASEYRWRCADGSWRHFLDQAVLIRGEDGEPDEIFGSLLDVTERRALEQQLVHAQKLETMGRLTGGIAHDFNNMLTVVIGCLDRLLQMPNLDKPAAKRADLALQGALRCADMTQRLLSFARRQPLQPRPVDANALVQGLAGIMERSLGEDIVLECALEDAPWPCTADRSQLEAALMNLVINARDAMPRGGRLVVGTANTSIGVEHGAQFRGLAPGDYVELSVADTGCGMQPEVLARVFDPFFTTKKVGEGTGLGLSIIYGFVKQSGGDIWIDSELGRGTTVKLLLPRDPTAPRDDAPVEADEASPARATDRAVILNVEDDADVRRVTAQMLRDFGYRVVEAADGPSALKLLKSRRRIDLVLTDWAMPGGMNGRELAEAALRERPQLPVLYTSAHLDDAAREIAAEQFLSKPYRDKDLAAAVHRALAGRRADP